MIMSKNILITGGAGFIGHHLIDYLLKKTDWNIVSLDRLDYSGNLNRLDYVIREYPRETQRRVKIVWHDLKAEIAEINQNFLGDINIIIHLAASSHVDRSITHPMEFLQDNTIGTLNVLNYARRLKNLERLIYFSTDEIFGDAPPGVLYGEYDRYNSTNPYSASKAAAEEFCVAYENTYKLPIYVTHCHDKQTKCWSEKGIVGVEELRVGDNVWVLQNNKTLALEPILEIVNEDYKGKMINFSSNNYNLSVTPNHRMLMKNTKNEKWKIKTAQEMFDCPDRQYIPSKGKWLGQECSTIDLSNLIETNTHSNENKLNTLIETKDFMNFLGWYISEGFTRTDKNSGEISISQKKHDGEKIKTYMSIFGLPVSSKTRSDGHILCILKNWQII